MTMRHVSRRTFLRWAVLAPAALAPGALAACEGSGRARPTLDWGTPVPSPAPTVVGSRHGEAPALTARVQAGELPPVDERLPADPCVCPVLERVGRYGGAIRRVTTGPGDPLAAQMVIDEGLLAVAPDLTLRANIASAWEANADASAWTVRLRQGLRFSDGEPLTAEAFLWWYRNELLNPSLTPSLPDAWAWGAERRPVEVTAPDAHTVVFRFGEPRPLFPYTLARAAPLRPGHYMKCYHGDLTDDREALEGEVSLAKVANWMALYALRADPLWNPRLPQLGAWVTRNTAASELFVMERNPYCFQVDPAANQLPYTEQVVHRQVQMRITDPSEVLKLWIMGGDVDYQARHLTREDWDLLAASQETGDYDLLPVQSDYTTVLCPNQTALDGPLRAFCANRNVRRALSLAIDRERIAGVVYDGRARPRQFGPSSLSPQYDAAAAGAWLDHDPAQANALLDGEGYGTLDGEGFRTHPGGGRLELRIDLADGSDVEELLMVIEDLRGVGIRAIYNEWGGAMQERNPQILMERAVGNEVQAVYGRARGGVLPLLNPQATLCLAPVLSPGPAWRAWREEVPAPHVEEPPEGHWLRAVWRAWDALARSGDAAFREAQFAEILRLHAEWLPYIGVCGDVQGPLVVARRLRNIPRDYRLPSSLETRYEALVPLQTLFWE